MWLETTLKLSAIAPHSTRHFISGKSAAIDYHTMALHETTS